MLQRIVNTDLVLRFRKVASREVGGKVLAYNDKFILFKGNKESSRSGIYITRLLLIPINEVINIRPAGG